MGLIRPPIIQVAIDVLKIDHALRIAEAAANAGADWLEAGTPLITFEGVRAIGAIAERFPELPVLADFKAMDGVAKYVRETANQGGRIATVCSVAADASIRAAVAAGREHGVAVVSDLYAALDVPARARQIAALGVASVYVHYGADERNEDPARDPLLHLPGTLEAVSVPVGVGTFSAEEGARAFALGAAIAAIGVPLINEPDPEAAFREYIARAREAYAARSA